MAALRRARGRGEAEAAAETFGRVLRNFGSLQNCVQISFDVPRVFTASADGTRRRSTPGQLVAIVDAASCHRPCRCRPRALHECARRQDKARVYKGVGMDRRPLSPSSTCAAIVFEHRQYLRKWSGPGEKFQRRLMVSRALRVRSPPTSGLFR